MKLFAAIIFLAGFSTTAFADVKETVVCTSNDGQISITATLSHDIHGYFSGSADYNGFHLTEKNNQGLDTLEAWTTNDMDNFQTEHLTFMENDNGRDRQAVLIEENHVDRIGFQNSVTLLTCQVK